MSYVIYADNSLGLLIFSNGFLKELFRRYPGDESLFGLLTHEYPTISGFNGRYPEICSGWSHIGPDLDFLQTDTGLWCSIDVNRFSQNELRTDSRIINLVRERGIDWSSGKHCRIGVTYVPPLCDWKIVGSQHESVEWNLPKDKIINALLGIGKPHSLATRLKESGETIEFMTQKYIEIADRMNAKIPRDFKHK